MLGLEEDERGALCWRRLLSRGLISAEAGRSGVSARKEWEVGPCCMGEGAGGAKGEGPCSAAFEVIAFCCRAQLSPQDNNMYYTYYVLVACKLHYK